MMAEIRLVCGPGMRKPSPSLIQRFVEFERWLNAGVERGRAGSRRSVANIAVTSAPIGAGIVALRATLR
jgi:hypothetical protein